MDNTNKHNELESNLIVAKIMRYSLLLVLLIILLSYFEVFILNKLFTALSLILISVLLSIPTLLVNAIGIEHWIIKYVIIGFSVIIVAILHMVFGYHVILLFLFPTLLSNIYFNKKISIFTIIFSVICMFFSHVLSTEYCFTPDEPLLEMKEALLYGFLPRVIEYGLLAAISMIIAFRNTKLFTHSVTSSSFMQAQNKALDTIIVSSYDVFGAKDLDEFHLMAKKAFTDTLGPFKKNPEDTIKFKIGYLSNGSYYMSSDGENVYEKLTPEQDLIKFKSEKSFVEININRSDKATRCTYYDNCFTATFFNERYLTHFILVDVELEESPGINDIIEILVGNIGIALKNLRLTLDMLATQSEMILSFSKISEYRSHQTGNHIKRVSEYMKVLARGAGYSPEYSDKIGIAAMMHDIGKVLIPDEIIDKKGKLTREEYDIVKTHTTRGVELISNVPGDIMALARIMIREHHEKWDGTGYIGLQGNQINIISRLIAVADVFDALISKRSYKEEWNPNDAYNKIISESGKHFDPRIISIFRKKYNELIQIHDLYPDY